ncbi:hypothetical protein ACFWRP_36460, partial [Streptomyces sp. NPDC058605]
MHEYSIRAAGPDDLDGARALMLDTVYRDFGTGYVPRWHADIVDPAAAYLASPRHTLLVALDPRDGDVVATAALDSRGPARREDAMTEDRARRRARLASGESGLLVEPAADAWV